MIIEYNHITLRYKDENILALKQDGDDVVIYFKNGGNHRLSGPQSQAPLGLSSSHRIHKSHVDTKAPSIPSETEDVAKRAKRKKNRKKLSGEW